jgi:hypothetical protein
MNALGGQHADLVSNRSLTFTAAGNGSVTVNCAAATNKTTCTAVDSPFLVRGSLLTPVAITPVIIPGPTGHGAASCDAASPSWTVSDIYYSDHEGDGINATAMQRFNFLLYNNHNGYQASCMSGDYAGEIQCAGNEFQAPSNGRYLITTSAVFDPVSYAFSLNQTWFCDDADPAKP